MDAYEPLEAGDPEQAGRFRIVGRLGGGGMGRVYLALSPAGRAVAVKVVRAELADDPGFRRRFVQEVEAARRVAGPFTAAVVDADPEGTPPWLATEYVPGLSLKAAVEAHGALPDRTVRALGAALAEALESVHAAGVVHRDLKPSNVLLAADGPRLIDFGIALASEGTRLTMTGAMVGTPGYMSPEQLRGGNVGPPSDVFALGAVLAYAATGSGPFGGGSAHALNYRVVHEAPDLTGVAPGLVDAVTRCLAKDPEQRPAVPELVEELGRGSHGWTSGGAGWLPEPVTAEITRLTAQPPVEPEGRTVADAAPTFVATAPYATPPAARPSPRGKRLFTRGRALTGAAAVTVAVTVLATLLLTGGEPDAGPAPEEPDPPVLKQLWSYEAAPDWAPVVADGKVYIGDGDGVVHAVDADTGERLWTKDRMWAGGSSLQVAGGAVYVSGYSASSRSDESSRMYALDPDSGRRLWETKPGQWGYRPIHSGGKIYFDSDRTGKFKKAVHALNSDTGEKAWTHNAEYVWALTATEETVYYAANSLDDPAPRLHALDAGTGERLWQIRAGDEVHERPVSLTVAGGVIYAIGDDGVVSARDSGDGELLWSRPTELSDFSDSRSPAIVGGVVYVSGNDQSQGDDGQVVAIDRATGKTMWRHGAAGVTSPPTVASGTVYVSTKAGELHLLNAGDGESLGKVQLADGSDANATVSGGVVYFDAGDGRLRAARITR